MWVQARYILLPELEDRIYAGEVPEALHLDVAPGSRRA